MKYTFEKFSSLDAFSDSLNRQVNKPFKAKNSLSSQKYDKECWSGTRTYTDALQLFNYGWTEKADEIRRDFAQFQKVHEATVSHTKSRPATAVVGFAPHVPNAILGLPNSMIYTERQPMKAKVVRIIYNMAMNAGTEAEDIMNTGLTVLKIAYSLERKGFRVRIDVNPFMSRRDNETACCLVTVKDWRQPIDIKKVAFPIAHPAMFRRLGFKWLETTPDLKAQGFIYGYGSSLEAPEDAKQVLKDCGELGDNDYFLNVRIAKKCKYDVIATAKAIGITTL